MNKNKEFDRSTPQSMIHEEEILFLAFLVCMQIHLGWPLELHQDFAIFAQSSSIKVSVKIRDSQLGCH